MIAAGTSGVATRRTPARLRVVDPARRAGRQSGERVNQMTVRCKKCGESFPFHPGTAELMDSKSHDGRGAIKKVTGHDDAIAKNAPKTHVAKCPHCGTNNTVRG